MTTLELELREAWTQDVFNSPRLQTKETSTKTDFTYIWWSNTSTRLNLHWIQNEAARSICKKHEDKKLITLHYHKKPLEKSCTDLCLSIHLEQFFAKFVCALFITLQYHRKTTQKFCTDRLFVQSLITNLWWTRITLIFFEWPGKDISILSQSLFIVTFTQNAAKSRFRCAGTQCKILPNCKVQ